MPTLKIKRMEAGNVNCYLLVGGKDAVLVDTGDLDLEQSFQTLLALVRRSVQP